MAVQMSDYSNSYSVDKRLTMMEVFERAARTKFGDDIRVVKARWITKQVEELDFEVSVVKTDPAPTEKNCTIADITTKEYFNPSDTSMDETVINLTKKNMRPVGKLYQFSTRKGVNWDLGGSFGAQMMGLATAGACGSIVEGNGGRKKFITSKKEQKQAPGFEMIYEQQEKICIQPNTKVKATITT